jgi:ubiquinone/menaquinone biosynthesis C-methylase UbiE
MNNENLKKSVKDFWNRNVCHAKFIKSPPGSLDFFEEAEYVRYKYHYHIPPLLDTIACNCQPNGKYLEIGCGMGTDALQIARKGISVTAIDLTDEGINLAKKRFDLYNCKADLRVADAENLPFDDATFDCVYSFGVLHHTPDTQKAINEIHRVLKPSGIAYIMLYNKLSLNYVAHLLTRTSFDAGFKGEKCPLEKAYTKKEVLLFFTKFSSITVSVEYLFGTGWGKINNFFPKSLHRLLGKIVGWHLLINAKK